MTGDLLHASGFSDESESGSRNGSSIFPYMESSLPYMDNSHEVTILCDYHSPYDVFLVCDEKNPVKWVDYSNGILPILATPWGAQCGSFIQ